MTNPQEVPWGVWPSVLIPCARYHEKEARKGSRQLVPLTEPYDTDPYPDRTWFSHAEAALLYYLAYEEWSDRLEQSILYGDSAPNTTEPVGILDLGNICMKGATVVREGNPAATFRLWVKTDALTGALTCQCDRCR